MKDIYEKEVNIGDLVIPISESWNDKRQANMNFTNLGIYLGDNKLFKNISPNSRKATPVAPITACADIERLVSESEILSNIKSELCTKYENYMKDKYSHSDIPEIGTVYSYNGKRYIYVGTAVLSDYNSRGIDKVVIDENQRYIKATHEKLASEEGIEKQVYIDYIAALCNYYNRIGENHPYNQIKSSSTLRKIGDGQIAVKDYLALRTNGYDVEYSRLLQELHKEIGLIEAIDTCNSVLFSSIKLKTKVDTITKLNISTEGNPHIIRCVHNNTTLDVGIDFSSCE